MKAKQSNNQQLEISAILLGKLTKNELIVTHLLFLPLNQNQNQNQNSSLTNAQEALANYYEAGFIILGWMSTHKPMDSIDFYRYLNDQQLVNETIVIVVPRDDDKIVINKLATLQFIANSRSSNITVKNEKELLSRHPNHVKFAPLKVQLVDLE